MRPLLDDHQLESSAVVANCRMNRERELTGGNGYGRELGFAPLDFLIERRGGGRVVRWLDLCCGSGRALLQAASQLQREGIADIDVTGVDLVGMFWPGERPGCLRLIASSIHTWSPQEHLDLVTCVHGLHYLGDKLRLIDRACSWLVEDGLFAANLDLANLRQEDGRPLARRLGTLFREAGITYTRRRLLTCRGGRSVQFPLSYLGADDSAGPNHTGQAAVNSWYRVGA